MKLSNLSYVVALGLSLAVTSTEARELGERPRREDRAAERRIDAPRIQGSDDRGTARQEDRRADRRADRRVTPGDDRGANRREDRRADRREDRGGSHGADDKGGSSGSGK